MRMTPRMMFRDCGKNLVLFEAHPFVAINKVDAGKSAVTG